MVGKIVNVTDRPLGSELAADTPSGASVLTVVDADDFEPEGGVLSLGDEVITYTAVDEDADQITLDSPTTDDHDEGDRVLLSPLATERVAYVATSHEDEDEDLPALVPLTLYAKLGVGLRDLEAGTGETVEVDYIGDELQVLNVYGAASFPVLSDHSAPPDDSLEAGDLAFWFDQTGGASKVMFKGRDEDGTIVTGEVSLT